MHRQHSTSHAMPAERTRHWNQAISEAYFPLDLTFQDARHFQGELDLWDLGPAALSRLATDGIQYRRRPHHLRRERDDQFLITVPERGDISFAQEGRAVRCAPGAFVIERSHLPYRFNHAEPATLWILKLPGAVLRAGLADPDSLASLRFESAGGAGRLFVETLRLLPGCLAGMTAAERTAVARQLVELLLLCLDADRDLGESAESSVRRAHLLRIRRYIRRNLAASALSPQDIAAACGISLRYLHQLFRAGGTTPGAWIREQRLAQADALLRDPQSRRSVAEVAYACGFGDQAQLARLYKARFGRTPSDTRRETRGRG